MTNMMQKYSIEQENIAKDFEKGAEVDLQIQPVESVTVTMENQFTFSQETYSLLETDENGFMCKQIDSEQIQDDTQRNIMENIDVLCHHFNDSSSSAAIRLIKSSGMLPKVRVQFKKGALNGFRLMEQSKTIRKEHKDQPK